LTADERPDGGAPALEVVILGGRPIGEPVAWYGPFVMNTKAELATAVEDFRAGRFGVIPSGALMPHVVRD
jgi:redox-sensitive bicupin YhaK (pirin superfamily)